MNLTDTEDLTANSRDRGRTGRRTREEERQASLLSPLQTPALPRKRKGVPLDKTEQTPLSRRTGQLAARRPRMGREILTLACREKKRTPL